MTSSKIFTEAETAYLHGQRLGRLATVAPDGTLQNNPVGFTIDNLLGTLDIRGYNLGASRKFHNVEANPEVAFVVDDIASYQPWKVRGIEIRGTAEAVRGAEPTDDWTSPEVIRIHPRRIIAWGIAPDTERMQARTVSAQP